MTVNEKTLLRQLKDGKPDAWSEFVSRYGARIHGLARRYVRTEADAEDLTQEIFVGICRGIGGFRGDCALSTWAYRIALNHCLRYQGRLKPEAASLDGAGAA